ncbi:transmembrane protein [Thalictrum thalictroides]|uniref:Transmembrane protein n=1 Tax=Thalictrum thalictroides TaxID=46969 RepID=A0A7J6WUP5_THATH|nr:transmembrane protein [Thalictrum thalictroides]
MGTREVYEEKLRSGNLHHDPTINPGLGSARCPRCLSLLNPNSETGEWTITPVLHNVTSVAGSGVGGLLSAVNGYNSGIPFIQKHVKGPKWLPFVIGVPSLFLFTAASATFGSYAVPKFAQLSLTSYYAAFSASHYTISHLTRYIEDSHTSSSSSSRSD